MSSHKNVPGPVKSDFLLAQLSTAGAQLSSEPDRKKSNSEMRGRWAWPEALPLRRSCPSTRTTPRTSEGRTDTEREFGNEEMETVAGGAPAHPRPAQRRDGLGQEGAAEESGTGQTLAQLCEDCEVPTPAVNPQKCHSPRLPHVSPSETAGAGTLQRWHFQQQRSVLVPTS